MFEKMIRAMERHTAEALRETGSANSLWRNEWAKLILRAFEPEQKVVYVSAYAFPMEILAAFDIVPFDFELAGAMIGTTKMGVPTMIESEDRGYSTDICSFHRLSLGASHLDYFPKPELLITTSFYCDGKAKTNELLSILHRKRAMALQVPAAINEDAIRYVERQLREIAAGISEAVGQPLRRRQIEGVRSELQPGQENAAEDAGSLDASPGSLGWSRADLVLDQLPLARRWRDQGEIEQPVSERDGAAHRDG